MANIIDISGKITNQLPVVKITDDIVVTVNNRKSTILNIQVMAREVEKKAEQRENSEDYDRIPFMRKTLEMLVGKKNADAIEALDLPMPEYSLVYETLMNTATGTVDEKDTP